MPAEAAIQRSAVAGARNLLLNCADAHPGDRLLILQESPELGFYAGGLTHATCIAAGEIGLDVTHRSVPFRPRVDGIPEPLAAEMDAAEHVVFFARLGDQMRFRPMPDGTRPVMCYALDEDMLASPFGTCDHQAFVRLKQVLDHAFARASTVRITCPLGSDFQGRAPAQTQVGSQVSVLRFPMSVFTPISCAGFSGRMAMARLLTGTGSSYYTPYGIRLSGVIHAELEHGRIEGFSGAAEEVERARVHYERVGEALGLDPYLAHSWHAGIHPGCRYPLSAHANYERWSGGAFGNPRILHIHTCGDYAPGEISVNILDPTITLDGVALWEHGRLRPDRLPGAQALLDRHPDMAALFSSPAMEVGL